MYAHVCVYSRLRVGDDGWPGRVRHKAVNRDMRHDGISPDQVLEEGGDTLFNLNP